MVLGITLEVIEKDNSDDQENEKVSSVWVLVWSPPWKNWIEKPLFLHILSLIRSWQTYCSLYEPQSHQPDISEESQLFVFYLAV